MKYFIVIACFVAVALAQPPPGCTILDRPKVKPSDCCRGTELVDKTEFEKCKALYPMQDNAEGIDRFIQRAHVVECYLNQTGVLKNGEINVDVALTHFSKIVDSPLRSMVKTAVEACRNEDGKGEEEGEAVGLRGMLKSVIQGIKQAIKEEGGPPSRLKAIAFFQCVERKVYEGCPADNKITSEECTQLTNFFEKCKMEQMDLV